MPKLAAEALREFHHYFQSAERQAQYPEKCWSALLAVAQSEGVAKSINKLLDVVANRMSAASLYELVADIIFQSMYGAFEFYLTDVRLPSQIAKEFEAIARALRSAAEKVEAIAKPVLYPGHPTYSKREVIVPKQCFLVSKPVVIKIFNHDGGICMNDGAGSIRTSLDIFSLIRLQNAFVNTFLDESKELRKTPKKGKGISQISMCAIDINRIFAKHVSYKDRSFLAAKNGVICELVNASLQSGPNNALSAAKLRKLISANRMRD